MTDKPLGKRWKPLAEQEPGERDRSTSRLALAEVKRTRRRRGRQDARKEGRP